MSKPARKPTEPLRTRHVFLDTEVYRRAGFNISNTQFALLGNEIDAGRVVLHFTDITLAEIQRRLRRGSPGQGGRCKASGSRLQSHLADRRALERNGEGD